MVGEDTSTSTSGMLSVSGFNASSQKYIYELSGLYIDPSREDVDEQFVLLDTQSFGDASSDYGDIGLFASLLIFVTLTFTGLWRASASIMMGMIAIVVAVFVGFLPIGQTALISVLSIGAILIWRMF